MQKPSPTLLQIISTDYLAQNYFVMIFGGWVIFGIDALFEGRTTWLLAVFAAVLTPLGLLAFFWRYRLIVSTFVNGIEVRGTITEIQTVNRDYILYYEYDFDELGYEDHNRIKQTPYAKTLRKNQKVSVMAHEKTPHIGFLKDLYLGIS